MSFQYENLMSPIKVGSLTINNRYAVGPMGGRFFLYGLKGEYTENGKEYFVSRARGGFGLIVTGSNVADLTVDPWDEMNGKPNPLYAPSYFGYTSKQMIERIHDYGSKIFLQISMGPGRMRDGKSCSPIPRYKDPSTLTEELTAEEIETKIAAMIKMAKAAKGWGYDGVEVHGMHWGYLLDQFAMAYTNHRTDEYGGDLDGRLTVVRKIITGIREACGADFAISVRLCMKTYMAGYNKSTLTGEEEVGRTIEEGVEIAKKLESYGADMLNVNTGTYDTFYYCVAPYYMEKGHNIAFAAKVKAAVDIPVFVAGKMDDAAMCEKAIADGMIDGVTLARASLCDAEYPQKVFMGKEEDIRPCIHCTNCIESNLAVGVPLCSVNPVAMNEYNYGMKKTTHPQKVMVVGGGVAGMEAARTAALCGHEVALYEASDRLCGHLEEAGSHPFKDGIARLNKWYQRELQKLNVEVHLSCPMDADKIKEAHPDTVILAVGSTHFVPASIPLNEQKHVSCYDALMKKKPIGEKVVIVGGGLTGCELAYELAVHEQKDVTVVEGLDALLSSGPAVPKAVKMMLLDLLEKGKITECTGHTLSEVSAEGAVVKAKDGSLHTIAADTVITAIGLRPRKDMTQELAGTGIRVYSVGDGRKIGNIRSCVAEAYEIASTL